MSRVPSWRRTASGDFRKVIEGNLTEIKMLWVRSGPMLPEAAIDELSDLHAELVDTIADMEAELAGKQRDEVPPSAAAGPDVRLVHHPEIGPLGPSVTLMALTPHGYACWRLIERLFQPFVRSGMQTNSVEFPSFRYNLSSICRVEEDYGRNHPKPKEEAS